MSLVGSLEDLGLGDILQIVHLSGKSGVLLLRSESGEGQIVFERGLVRAATTRELPQDLRELISRHSAVPAEALGDAAREARRASEPLASVLTKRGLLSDEAIDDLRAQAITDAVLQMFRWRVGEFSFEVREGAVGDDGLALAKGLNPQFLALEASREDDEGGDQEEEAVDEESTGTISAPPLEPDTDPFASEAPLVEAQPVAEEVEAEAAIFAEEPADELAAPVALGETPSVAREHARAAAPTPDAVRTSAGAGAALSQPPPVVVVDTSLAVLEWTKAALTGHPRVHTFQHTELGIQRIRQYLLRRELPVVLLSADTPPDPVSGARDVFDVAARLRRQAPRLPIVVLTPAGARPPARRRTGAAPNAYAERPKDGALTDQRRSPERLQLAAALREVVERLPNSLPAAAQAAPSSAAPSGPDPELARLREASSRMRERSRQGEVLSNVLSFAAQSFSRVALFMVREDSIVGIGQLGLGKAGGPDDAALRDVHLGARESSWIRKVLDSLQPVRGRPADDGDHRLCVMLGNEIPNEAFLAPLESANRVVAILYADNLPGRALLPDTGALEVVLHEAGLALDRTLLERALAEASDGARAAASS